MMPGSFPSSSSNMHASRATDPGEVNGSWIRQEQCREFIRNESLGLKTQLQRHMVGQLNALALILIIYLLIRYTYFSCYIAALLDCVVQILLHASSFANGEGSRIFETLLALLEDATSRPNVMVSPAKIVEFVVQNTRYLVFFKAALNMLQHISNCFFWLRPIAIGGSAELLEHGPIFFVSFLGESIPLSNSANSLWLVQLWRLGLFELLALDIVILLIQLILYQSIFRQSTISPAGLRLNVEEKYILRAKGISASPEDPAEGVPEILHIKLYESLWDHA